MQCKFNETFIEQQYALLTNNILLKIHDNAVQISKVFIEIAHFLVLVEIVIILIELKNEIWRNAHVLVMFPLQH